MHDTNSRHDASTAETLLAAFRETPHGQKLADESRFWPYVDGHMSHAAWQELAGPDVNNLEHMRYTLALTNYYIRTTLDHCPTTFADEDAEQLRIAAAIHDCGESIAGDILAPLKDESIVHAEQQAYHDHIQEFFPGESEETYAYLLRIVDEVVFGKDTPLAKHFNAIENLGYLQTALKLYARIHHTPESIPNQPALEGMNAAVASVIANSLNRTGAYYDDPTFPAVRAFVDNRLELLYKATKDIPWSSFNFFKEPLRQQEKNKFVQAAGFWQAEYNKRAIRRKRRWYEAVS